MNSTTGTTVLSVVIETPALDTLVIEDFGQLSTEPFQPSTCICWTNAASR
ncbi:hypothetical protein [Streptomyces sp. ST2-7A]|nr:hypothetical protein [Streptomyces sp. ST2-7A]MCE7082358.1 hypothetical protein [Streptomyces sp. ST2-7A]